MAEQTVTLQPGESKAVSFEAIPHEARTYQVSVNGLTGSFVAIPALPPIEITGISLTPTDLPGKTPFNIAITLRNNLGYDIWVNPEFAFGIWDGVFSPIKALARWDDETNTFYGAETWHSLGYPYHPASGMSQVIVDPDGVRCEAFSVAYLKVPGKSEVTTSLDWQISTPVSPLPSVDLCIRIDRIKYLEYVGEPLLWTDSLYRVRDKAVDIIGKAEDVGTTIPPETVTIDSFKFRFGQSIMEADVVLTNHTGVTFITEPGTGFRIRTQLGTSLYVIDLPYLRVFGSLKYKRSDAYDLPKLSPGTHTIRLYNEWNPAWTEKYIGEQGYAKVSFGVTDYRPTPVESIVSVSQWFEAIYGIGWETWSKRSTEPPLEEEEPAE